MLESCHSERSEAATQPEMFRSEARLSISAHLLLSFSIDSPEMFESLVSPENVRAALQRFAQHDKEHARAGCAMLAWIY
jgi:hypothetical protein